MSNPKERKADKLGGPNSLIDKLRKKRIEAESSDDGTDQGDSTIKQDIPGPDHYRGYTKIKGGF